MYMMPGQQPGVVVYGQPMQGQPGMMMGMYDQQPQTTVQASGVTIGHSHGHG